MSPSPTFETILIDQLSDGAVLISYNTPKRSNAFTPQQYNDLREALLWARDEEGVKAVVVTGKGKHYCAGRAMGSPSTDTIDAEVAAGSALSAVLTSYPKVLIAAVHGASIGWGCTQLAYFDLVYANGNAFFETPFARIGIVPEGGSSYTFPKAMGRPRANALLLAGERLSAHDAWVGGLITVVIDAKSNVEFLDRVVEKAKRVGEYSGEALRLAKKLIADSADDVEARRKAGERERRDILYMFSRPETQANLASLSFGKKGGSKI
ncbi:ClpP/crotonase-like domain-containing protein [Lophiotrema nucula]|uniref:ClpP/crotonase-like domain-containing protein n=1 Tax=Lophiotrema nucula TaxID=690887 RepID=A0A6A5ZR88_9PLEO|nr:ClpP/crotonase-like domain-containing protein [Lophiotrema nucula]